MLSFRRSRRFLRAAVSWRLRQQAQLLLAHQGSSSQCPGVPCRLVDELGQPIGPFRVWLQRAWVPGLAMSRAIGDVLAHKCASPHAAILPAQACCLIMFNEAFAGSWKSVDA